MKSSKFEFDLTDDLIITEENVQAIGERVALGSVRFLMRYSGTMLNRLYWELCEEVFRPHTLQRNLSDAYDIAQEAICHLCSYIGRPFGEVIGTNKNGNPVTVRHDCFRITIRYVAHHVTPRFVINFVEKTIIGTKASFDKAGKGKGAVYEELAAKIAAHPKFELKIKDQNKRSNKAKQTYNGLNFDLMEKYIAIQDNAETLLRAYNGAKKMATDTGVSMYPFTKKWFLGQFKDFDVVEAKKEISDYYISLVDRNTAATPSGKDDVADVA